MRGPVLWVTAQNSWDEGALAASFGTVWLLQLGVSASVQPIRQGAGPAMMWPPGVSAGTPFLTERRRGFRRPKFPLPDAAGFGTVVIDQDVHNAWGADLTMPVGMRTALFMRTVPEPGFDPASLSAYDAIWAANRPVWDVVRSWTVVAESRLWLVPPPPLGLGGDAWSAGSRSLVTAGVLDVVKGLDMVLNALTVLRDRGQTWQLTVLGDGPERSRWTVYAASLGLDVHFEATVLAWDTVIAAADILLAPQFRDGLGWDVASAARMGTRVIMSDLPTLREHIRHTSDVEILRETRAADLVEAMETMAAHPSPRSEGVAADQISAVWREMLD